MPHETGPCTGTAGGGRLLHLGPLRTFASLRAAVPRRTVAPPPFLVIHRPSGDRTWTRFATDGTSPSLPKGRILAVPQGRIRVVLRNYGRDALVASGLCNCLQRQWYMGGPNNAPQPLHMVLCMSKIERFQHDPRTPLIDHAKRHVERSNRYGNEIRVTSCHKGKGHKDFVNFVFFAAHNI